MDEPRDPAPGGGSSTRRPIAAAVQLSPSQEAWGEYARHTIGCVVCRDVEQSCDESGRLYRVWQAHADAAYGQLGGEPA